MSASRQLTLALVISSACAASAQPLPDEPLRPLPVSVDADPARAAIGKRLFHDPRLSPGSRTSCASCHNLLRGGADGQPRSASVDGKPGLYNTPSIYNSYFNARQSWAGRPISLERLPMHAGFGDSWELLATRSATICALCRLPHASTAICAATARR